MIVAIMCLVCREKAISLTLSQNQGNITMDYYADRLGDTFQNDAIFPAQFAAMRARRVFSAEQNLWWAVLVDAIAWAIKKPKTNPQRIARQAALAWLEGTEKPKVGCVSLDFVCEALNLDSDWIRERVRAGDLKLVRGHRCVVARSQAMACRAAGISKGRRFDVAGEGFEPSASGL